jgi:hypothetical protein
VQLCCVVLRNTVSAAAANKIDKRKILFLWFYFCVGNFDTNFTIATVQQTAIPLKETRRVGKMFFC